MGLSLRFGKAIGTPTDFLLAKELPLPPEYDGSLFFGWTEVAAAQRVCGALARLWPQRYHGAIIFLKNRRRKEIIEDLRLVVRQRVVVSRPLRPNRDLMFALNFMGALSSRVALKTSEPAGANCDSWIFPKLEELLWFLEETERRFGRHAAVWVY